MGYYIHQNGENYGPYTIGQLQSMWSAGEVTGDTLYCEEGYTEWLHLSVLLDPQEQLPLLQPTVRARSRKPLVIAGVVSAVLIVICIFAAMLSPGGKPAVAVQQPAPPSAPSIQPASSVSSQPPAHTADAVSETVTEDYARRINAFASKWDMTVEAVMRLDYVFTRRGLTLGDFDEALAKLDQSRDIALGYHPNIPKRNANGRRLVVGETKFPQNPVITEDEENTVKMLRMAGYGGGDDGKSKRQTQVDAGQHHLTVNASISHDDYTIRIRNADTKDWPPLNAYINPGFWGPLSGYGVRLPTLEMGGKIDVPLNQFTKDNGERFNPYAYKVTKLWIGGDNYDYVEFGL
jgi:hypothetical protein